MALKRFEEMESPLGTNIQHPIASFASTPRLEKSLTSG
jgi:hypothetical protein